MIHITAEATSAVTAKQALEPLVRSLTSIPRSEGEGGSADDVANMKGAGKPLLLWEIYFTKEASSVSDGVAATIPHGLVLSSAKGEGDVHFEAATQDAERMFRAVLPNEDFLPPAPNPEDIVWEGGQEEDDAGGAGEAGEAGSAVESRVENRVAAVEVEAAALKEEVAAVCARARVAAVSVSTTEIMLELEALALRIGSLSSRASLVGGESFA